MPLKKISNREFKRMYKPWITHGILNSMKRKDKLFSRNVKSKNNIFKDSIHEEYKVLRNQINELIRFLKQEKQFWKILLWTFQQY